MKLPPILIQLAGGLVRGQRPEDIARAVENVVKARGGDPAEMWQLIHQTASERLAELGASPAEPPPGPLVECGSCGGWKATA
jgi:hypothetical protein